MRRRMMILLARSIQVRCCSPKNILGHLVRKSVFLLTLYDSLSYVTKIGSDIKTKERKLPRHLTQTKIKKNRNTIGTIKQESLIQ